MFHVIYNFCTPNDNQEKKVKEYETPYYKIYAMDDFTIDNQEYEKHTLVITNKSDFIDAARNAQNCVIIEPDHARAIKYFNALKKITLFYGPGGCGKTYTINQLIDYMEFAGIPYAATASTGIAALNFKGGMTIHSWSGVGIRTEIDYGDKNYLKPKHKRRINKVKYLILDEISMISAEFLDMLNGLFQKVRRSEEPFGGIVMILSGDFKQLRPVSRNKKLKLAHKAKCWKDVKIIKMNKPKRFDDMEYFRFLQRLRNKKVTKNDIEKLRGRLIKNHKLEDDIEPTILYSKNVDVENYNRKRLDELPGQSVVFAAADDYGDIPKRIRKKLANNLEIVCPEKLELKLGAQVMLRRNLNISAGLCNGSRGVVTKLEPLTVKFLCGAEIAMEKIRFEFKWDKKTYSRTQIPLILGWAITIHKSQGCTLDRIICRIDNSIFEYAQLYVSLSRIRNWNSLFLTDLDESVFFN